MTLQARAGRSLLAVYLLGAMIAAVSETVGTTGTEQAGGTISGRITLDGTVEPRMLEVTADQAVCGNEVEDRAVVVDGSGGLANAVVIVAGAPWGDATPVDPEINNSGCYFVPRVQVVPTRTVVTVRSEDDTLHTTHAYDDRQRTLFNIAIPIPGMEVERPLRRPGPVRIECDSHGWMRGWVYVTDDLGTVTGPDGSYELSGIPPGDYTLTVWHERAAGMTRAIQVTAGGTAEADFTLALE